MKRLFIILLSQVFILPAMSQEPILDGYIREGLSNNLALKQKLLNYNRSLQSLNQARALFFPDIGFSARFTVADGGRYIDFPVGDLLNPVYSTLNELTHSQKFPQVENQEVYFVRPTEQETKFSLLQPLFRPDLFFNFKIRKNLSDAAFIDVSIYRRELVKEIKTSWFNYLKTLKALTLFENTLRLVGENVRVNESLYRNDKVTYDVVLRSQAEFSKVERQLAEAANYHERAKGYFNFLLNRPLKSGILVPEYEAIILHPEMEEEHALRLALTAREELSRLREYLNAGENSLRLYRYNTAPTLGMAIDYGIQGENYRIGPDSDFLFASLVLRWSIFRGLENRSKIREAAIHVNILDEQYLEVQNQISLQVSDSWYGVKTAIKAVNASLMQSESASRAFDLIHKKYNQGQSSLLEFIDARTAMTSAELNLIIARYDYEISLADLERSISSYPLP